MLHKQIVWFYFTVLSFFIASAQQSFMHNQYFRLSFEKALLSSSVNVSPSFLQDTLTDIVSDSMMKSASLVRKEKWIILPLLHLCGKTYFENTSSSVLYRVPFMAADPGFYFQYRSKKWNLQGAGQSHFYFPSSHTLFYSYKFQEPVYAYSRLYEITPGRIYFSYYLEGNIRYRPNRYFEFGTGKGKFFIGNGLRSLLLSSETSSYPYISARVKLWRLNYQYALCLWNDFEPSFNLEQNKILYRVAYKPGVFHYLSVTSTKWWEIGLFETILWQAKNGNVTRGIDFSYLNPIVFFRPVEFANGSADNALAGINNSFRIANKLLLYQQFLIDEFLLEEIKAGRGWWGNKFAMQAGFSWFDVLGLKNTFIKSEYNFIRPFTYAHASSRSDEETLGIQNYAHGRMPLAHPNGANLQEILLWIGWDHRRWHISSRISLLQQGLDSTDTNLGSNIFKSYTTRTRTYHNKFLQGIPWHILTFSIPIQYKINGIHYLFIHPQGTLFSFSNYSGDAYGVILGFRTYFNRAHIQEY